MNVLKFFPGFLKNEEKGIGKKLYFLKTFFLLFFLLGSLVYSESLVAQESVEGFKKWWNEATRLFQETNEKFQSNRSDHTCESPTEKADAKTLLKDIHGDKIEISLMSLAKATELFNFLSDQKEIPFDYPDDGCYARAHKMAKLLENKGITVGKVFLEAEEDGELWVWTPKHPEGHVEWSYHTAVIVSVKTKEGEKPYVIDPSLFTKPVSVAEWKKIQTQHSAVEAKLFFTKRFNYDDENWKRKLDSYQEKDLINMKKFLEKILNSKNLESI